MAKTLQREVAVSKLLEKIACGVSRSEREALSDFLEFSTRPARQANESALRLMHAIAMANGSLSVRN